MVSIKSSRRSSVDDATSNHKSVAAIVFLKARFRIKTSEGSQIGLIISKMKQSILLLTLIVLTFSSCKPHQALSNINASSKKPDERASISQSQSQKPCVNLNVATAEELKELPGIGDVMAQRVIDYREQNGRFRRREEIIIIEGFSEKKYRAIAEMICVE